MADVLVFDHIPKTAGSTVRHVLFRVFGGGDRVFLSTQIGNHPERVGELISMLEDDRPEVSAVVSHVGVGLHELLPSRHRYTRFTILRDPVKRTVSNYLYGLQRGKVPSGISLEEWLDWDLVQGHNAQTGFLGGLHEEWHLHASAPTKDMFTRELLERAERNLLDYEAVGITERLDETLLLLRETFGWSFGQILHRRVNVGRRRADGASLSPEALEAVRAHNELDIELYESARRLFEEQLSERLPLGRPRAAAFRRANALYGGAYPVIYPPARAVVHLGRRVRRA